MAKLSPDAQEFYKARIGNIQFVFLLICYTIVYALQFALDLTVLLSILAAFIGFVVTTALTLYLYVKGAYKSKKNAALKQIVTMLTFLIEMIPEIDLIPSDILDIAAMFILTHMEDREVAQEKALAAQQEAQTQQLRAAQFAEYAARQQRAQTQIEEEEEVEQAEVVAANNNRTREELEAEGEEPEENELEEYPYPQAA